MKMIEFKKTPSDFQDEYVKMYPDRVNKEGTSVKNLTFVVTNDCPMACAYCYLHCKNKDRMTFDQGRRIVDLLFESEARADRYLNSQNADALILEFIGGEPFLEIDLIDQILRYFRWKALKLNHRWATQYMISISTNGVLYTDTKVQNFILKNLGRLSLTITVDGNKELHDSCRILKDGSPTYDIVTNAVKLYRGLVPILYTKLTLAPANIKFTSAAIRNLREELNMDGVYANCVYEEGWTYEDAKIFYNQLKEVADWIINNDLEDKFFCTLFDESIGRPIEASDLDVYCGGNARMLSFTPDGKIQPCLRFTQSSLGTNQPQVDIGDIESGVGRAPDHCKNLQELEEIDRRSISTDECFNCPIGSGCAYCVAYNYEIFGTPNSRATYICPMHKARVLANRYYWQLLYKKHQVDKTFPLEIPDEWALQIIDEDELQMLKDL